MDAGLPTSEVEAAGQVFRPQRGKRTVVTKYTPHACAQCKKAKTKCRGGKPVCERCQRTGHECNWSLEDARRPLTRAHEQALKHQNALLRAEVERLGREVAVLQLQSSPNPSSSEPPMSTSLLSLPREDDVESFGHQHSAASFLPSSQHGSPDQNMWSMQVENARRAVRTHDSPQRFASSEVINGAVQRSIDDSDSDGFDNASDSDSDSVSEQDSGRDGDDSDIDVDNALAAPTKTLFTEQDDFHHYGLTSVFRLRRRASRRNLSLLASGTEESATGGYDSSQDVRTSRFNRTSRRSLLLSSKADDERQEHMQHDYLHATVPALANESLKRGRKGRKLLKPSVSRPISPTRVEQHTLFTGEIEDGAWKGCPCQSDCWNRWLPKGVPLSRREHDILLERVFLFFTSWCMRIIPAYFLRDMYCFLHPTVSLPTFPSLRRPSTSVPRLAHYSPFLHNMLLAVGTAFSLDPNIRKPETRARFAEEGKAYIDEECSRPNISTVQALGLLASYYSGQGQQTLGFTYFGMAARIAQALGLSADCTPLLRAGRLRPQQVFDRTWCFHMAAAQDACWSTYVGRECGIPLPASKGKEKPKSSGGTTVVDSQKSAKHDSGKKPPAFSIEDPFCLSLISAGELGEKLNRMTWRVTGESNHMNESDAPQCNTFTAFQWSCQLMKIARSIMELMNRLALSDIGTEVKLLVADIDIQLDAWRQDLPPELKLTPANEMHAFPHKLMMHAAFWWQHILLHRPFYQRRRAKLEDSLFSVTRCNVAAREILYVLRLYNKQYGTVRFCSITLIQAIFAAGTIYVLQAMQASTGRRPAPQSQAAALGNLEELIGYLRECSESWECAKRIADIFEKLLKEKRRAMEAGVPIHSAKNARRKRRRRDIRNDDSGTGISAERPSLDQSLALLDARTDDGSDGNFMTSPIQIVQCIPPDTSHQTIPDQLHAGFSPDFDSPIINMTHPFIQHHRESTNFTDDYRAGFLSAHEASHPIGFLSDESYVSDIPYLSTDDLDQAMEDTSEPGTGALDIDFDFLLNSGVNMDTIMPGMGMFDPTGLPGLAFGPITAAEAMRLEQNSNSVTCSVNDDSTSLATDGASSAHVNFGGEEWGFANSSEMDHALYGMLSVFHNNNITQS